MEIKNANNVINFVNGTRFTAREIDIISCIISGRSVKAISNLPISQQKRLILIYEI
jgi:hypothetical protein